MVPADWVAERKSGEIVSGSNEGVEVRALLTLEDADVVLVVDVVLLGHVVGIASGQFGDCLALGWC